MFTGTGFQNRSVCRHGFSRPPRSVCWHGFSIQPRSLFAVTGFQDSPVLLLFAGTGFQDSPVLCCLLARVSNSVPFSVVCWHGFPTQPRSLLFAGTGSVQPRSLLFVAMGFIRQPDSPVLCCLLAGFSGQPRSLLLAGVGFQDRLVFCCLLALVLRTALCSVVCRHGFSGQPLSSHHFGNWVWVKFTPELSLPRQE